MLGDIAQTDLFAAVAVEDLAGPDERVAAFQTTTVGDGVVIVLVCRGRGLDGLGIRPGNRNGHICEAATDNVEQQRIAAFGIAIDFGFMRKFKADAVIAKPANGALDLRPLRQR